MAGECCGGTRLIFSCSGAADVGEIADRAARRLTAEGTGRMFCLAGIGGRVSGILKTTETAQAVLVVDGCDLACAKRSLEAAGFSGFLWFHLGEIGLEKGKSPLTEEAVARTAEKCREILADV